MNTIQRLTALFGALMVAGLALFPPWDIEWTVAYDYQYSYEADAKTSDAPAAESPARLGRESERLQETRRAFLFRGPRPPLPVLPPPQAEYVGTGAVDLGRRLTTYTAATLTDFNARLRVRQMVGEIVAAAVPMAFLVLMFRSPVRNKPWDTPKASYPPGLKIKLPPPNRPDAPPPPPPSGKG
jgi:hypothetical protein